MNYWEGLGPPPCGGVIHVLTAGRLAMALRTGLLSGVPARAAAHWGLPALLGRRRVSVVCGGGGPPRLLFQAVGAVEAARRCPREAVAVGDMAIDPESCQGVWVVLRRGRDGAVLRWGCDSPTEHAQWLVWLITLRELVADGAAPDCSLPAEESGYEACARLLCAPSAVLPIVERGEVVGIPAHHPECGSDSAALLALEVAEGCWRAQLASDEATAGAEIIAEQRGLSAPLLHALLEDSAMGSASKCWLRCVEESLPSPVASPIPTSRITSANRDRAASVRRRAVSFKGDDDSFYLPLPSIADRCSDESDRVEAPSQSVSLSISRKSSTLRLDDGNSVMVVEDHITESAELQAHVIATSFVVVAPMIGDASVVGGLLHSAKEALTKSQSRVEGEMELLLTPMFSKYSATGAFGEDWGLATQFDALGPSSSAPLLPNGGLLTLYRPKSVWQRLVTETSRLLRQSDDGFVRISDESERPDLRSRRDRDALWRDHSNIVQRFDLRYLVDMEFEHVPAHEAATFCDGRLLAKEAMRLEREMAAAREREERSRRASLAPCEEEDSTGGSVLGHSMISSPFMWAKTRLNSLFVPRPADARERLHMYRCYGEIGLRLIFAESSLDAIDRRVFRSPTSVLQLRFVTARECVLFQQQIALLSSRYMVAALRDPCHTILPYWADDGSAGDITDAEVSVESVTADEDRARSAELLAARPSRAPVTTFVNRFIRGAREEDAVDAVGAGGHGAAVLPVAYAEGWMQAVPPAAPSGSLEVADYPPAEARAVSYAVRCEVVATYAQSVSYTHLSPEGDEITSTTEVDCMRFVVLTAAALKDRVAGRSQWLVPITALRVVVEDEDWGSTFVLEIDVTAATTALKLISPASALCKDASAALQRLLRLQRSSVRLEGRCRSVVERLRWTQWFDVVQGPLSAGFRHRQLQQEIRRRRAALEAYVAGLDALAGPAHSPLGCAAMDHAPPWMLREARRCALGMSVVFDQFALASVVGGDADQQVDFSVASTSSSDEEERGAPSAGQGSTAGNASPHREPLFSKNTMRSDSESPRRRQRPAGPTLPVWSRLVGPAPTFGRLVLVSGLHAKDHMDSFSSAADMTLRFAQIATAPMDWRDDAVFSRAAQMRFAALCTAAAADILSVRAPDTLVDVTRIARIVQTGAHTCLMALRGTKEVVKVVCLQEEALALLKRVTGNAPARGGHTPKSCGNLQPEGPDWW